MNNNILIAIIMISLVAIGLFIFLNKNSKEPLYKLAVFLTENEKKCFHYLKTIYPQFHIAPQVGMESLLIPNRDQNNKTRSHDSYYSLRNKIKANRIDFVMLNKDLMPVFIVELDDKSHDTKIDADRIRDKNLLDVGIPTVRFRNVKGKFPTRDILDKELKSQKPDIAL